MPISSLLEGTTFDSPEVSVIIESFEEVLSRLDIARGSDPVREELIAHDRRRRGRSRGAPASG
jgi:hypothetical protein